MYRHTIHDGSVSYSVMLPDPPEGNGKHYKRPEPIHEVLRKMHLACIGNPQKSSQLIQDATNRRIRNGV